MNFRIKQNIPLVVGLAIPVLMIVFVAGAIYVPGLFIKPQYNFLYAVGGYPTYAEQADGQYIQHSYSVRDKKLKAQTWTITGKEFYRESQPPRFYIYNVADNSNEEITFAEAESLILDTNRESPDGFEVIRNRGDYDVFSLFVGGGRQGKDFLKGGNVSREIELKGDSSNYYYGGGR